jgi:hypothetical protein
MKISLFLTKKEIELLKSAIYYYLKYENLVFDNFTNENEKMKIENTILSKCFIEIENTKDLTIVFEFIPFLRIALNKYKSYFPNELSEIKTIEYIINKISNGNKS